MPSAKVVCLFINGTAEPWEFSRFSRGWREQEEAVAGAGGRRPGVPRLQQVRGGVGSVGCVGCVVLGVVEGGPERCRDEQGSRSREGQSSSRAEPGALGGAAGHAWCQGVAALTKGRRLNHSWSSSFQMTLKKRNVNKLKQKKTKVFLGGQTNLKQKKKKGRITKHWDQKRTEPGVC